MIYMWFTGKNYYNLAVEKDRGSINHKETWLYGLVLPGAGCSKVD
jgi:hypothetical protein